MTRSNKANGRRGYRPDVERRGEEEARLGHVKVAGRRQLSAQTLVAEELARWGPPPDPSKCPLAMCFPLSFLLQRSGENERYWSSTIASCSPTSNNYETATYLHNQDFDPLCPTHCKPVVYHRIMLPPERTVAEPSVLTNNYTTASENNSYTVTFTATVDNSSRTSITDQYTSNYRS